MMLANYAAIVTEAAYPETHVGHVEDFLRKLPGQGIRHPNTR